MIMKKTLSSIFLAVALLALLWCCGEPADGRLDAAWLGGELAGLLIAVGSCAAAKKLNPELCK